MFVANHLNDPAMNIYANHLQETRTLLGQLGACAELGGDRSSS